ncbi:hypothetical protein L9F63_011271, partial [Diploptera punctata]
SKAAAERSIQAMNTLVNVNMQMARFSMHQTKCDTCQLARSAGVECTPLKMNQRFSTYTQYCK